jgi:hypothetical protein
MCSEMVAREHLKTVAFSLTAEPVDGEPFEFTLVQCARGSMQPTAVTAARAAGALGVLGLGLDSGSTSVFSRVLVTTAAMLEEEMEGELAQLEDFRQRCLPLPEQVGGKGWNPLPSEAHFSKSGGGGGDEDGAGGSSKGADTGIGTGTVYNTVDDTPDCDVEYIPSIAEAISAVHDRRDALQVRAAKAKLTKSSSSSAASSGASSGTAPTGAPTVFFQSGDGGLCFLHPLCFKALLAEAAEDSSVLPLRVCANVLEVEVLKVTKELRARMLFMRHLPLHSTVKLVELDVKKLVDRKHLEASGVLAEVDRRAKRRKTREKVAAKESRKDVLFLESQEEKVAAMKARHEVRQQERQAVIGELFAGPALGVGCGSVCDGAEGATLTPAVEMGCSPPIAQFSFATIAGEGYFPELARPDLTAVTEGAHAVGVVKTSAPSPGAPAPAPAQAPAPAPALTQAPALARTPWDTMQTPSTKTLPPSAQAMQTKGNQKGRKKVVLSGFL